MTGIGFSPMFFGEVLAIINIICGLTAIMGFLFKTSCFLLGLTFLLETIAAALIGKGTFSCIVPGFTIGMVTFGLIFIGSGKFSVKN
jgi:uncharacterized membrane protein YphA (DoxX/SURF4 family)